MLIAARPAGLIWEMWAKTWCMETTNTPWAVGEAALAHTIGNSTEAAYARSDLFERRRTLMQEWAAYVTGGALSEGGTGG